jgi:hypothetical protein
MHYFGEASNDCEGGGIKITEDKHLFIRRRNVSINGERLSPSDKSAVQGCLVLCLRTTFIADRPSFTSQAMKLPFSSGVYPLLLLLL